MPLARRRGELPVIANVPDSRGRVAASERPGSAAGDASGCSPLGCLHLSTAAFLGPDGVVVPEPGAGSVRRRQVGCYHLVRVPGSTS